MEKTFDQLISLVSNDMEAFERERIRMIRDYIENPERVVSKKKLKELQSRIDGICDGSGSSQQSVIQIFRMMKDLQPGP